MRAPVAGGLVLVVDDSTVNRKLLERALRSEGHSTLLASDGEQALSLLARPRQPSIDIVLLDLMMPGLDGFATLERIKADERMRHLPVIVISAVDETESVARCIEMGATDYLPKPFSMPILRARVNASLAEKRLRDLERQYVEQSRENERLLLNILPAPIADRLRRGERVIADRFEDVSMLIADIVGFTGLSSLLSAVEVVDMLNRVFGAIDELVDQHGLEKVKTIGDAYMVVGGIPTEMEDSTERVAAFALDLAERVQELRHGARQTVSLRIGMHCGPAVAGVIGQRKFIYDVWGDTVNVASRMESQGLPGRIQVSQQVHDRLAGKYRFEPRGLVEVKGKGPLQTYFLLGAADSPKDRPAASPREAIPPQPA